MKVYARTGCSALKRFQAPTRPLDRHKKNNAEQGMAVIIVLTLVVIVLMYLSFNLRTLALLERELHLLDKQQRQRLVLSVSPAISATGTNQVTTKPNAITK